MLADIKYIHVISCFYLSVSNSGRSLWAEQLQGEPVLQHTLLFSQLGAFPLSRTQSQLENEAANEELINPAAFWQVV